MGEPEITFTLSKLFATLLLLICLIGLFGRYQQLAKDADAVRDALLKPASHLSLLLSMGLHLFFALVGFSMLVIFTLYAQHYYDFFILETLFYPLFLVVPVLMSLATLHYMVEGKNFDLLSILLAIIPLLVTALSLTIPSLVAENIHILLAPPHLDEGYVSAREISQMSRGGTSYYIFIDGVEYLVLDASWFDSLEEGERVAFATNPMGRATWLRPGRVAFPPDKLGPTPLSLFASIIGSVLWLGVAIHSYEGLRYLQRRRAAPVEQST